MGTVGFSIFIAVLALLVGLAFIFAPGMLRKLNEISARMVARADLVTFSYRIGVGISLLIVAAFMFFMAYYFYKRY